MAGDDELNLTQWAAVVMLLLLLLVPLAVAGAAWARRRYVKAVLALQAELAAGESATPETPRRGHGVALPLQYTPADAAGRDGTAAAPARRLRRRVLGVQFGAGLLYWWLLLLCLLLGLFWWDQLAGESLSAEGEEPASGLALNFVLWPLLLLPALLGWAFQAGLPEKRVWAAAAVGTLAFAAGLVATGAGWGSVAAVAGAAGLLAAMIAAFLRPAVRGAGPPLVAALSVAIVVFGLLCMLAAGLDESDADAPLDGGDWVIGLAALAVFIALSAAAAWRVLLRLARRYAEKRFSEMQLALDAYWGVVTAFTGGAVLMLSFDERTGAAMEWLAAFIVVAWYAWRLLQRGALALARRRAAPALPALLMLRVFKPSQRSEAFTDRFLARWRFAGPVWMIAGPDLAGAYMEPDEFFAFLRGRLREHFIVDAAELPQRLQALDDVRDPDGRFRVNELFCSNSTWQPAVLALIARAGVVLLDLREYHPGRSGTRFELESVLQRLPLHKLIVLIDRDDVRAPLEAALADAWDKVDLAQRPDDLHLLRLMEVGPGSGAEMAGLLAAAAAAARASNVRG